MVEKGCPDPRIVIRRHHTELKLCSSMDGHPHVCMEVAACKALQTTESTAADGAGAPPVVMQTVNGSLQGIHAAP